MHKLTLLLILSFITHAEPSAQSDQPLNHNSDVGHHRYVSVKDGRIYDVEIIVFAYKNALPNAKTYHDTSIINDQHALSLLPKPVDLTEILSPELHDQGIQNPSISTASPQKNAKEYTVNIGKKIDQHKLLAWFKHKPEQLKMTAIWQRLQKNGNIVPLFHESWRQQQTDFDEPIYIKIGHNDNEANMNKEQQQNDSNFSNNNTDVTSLTDNEDIAFTDTKNQSIQPDYHLTGMVALSKGRFMHFGNQLKLYRQYYDDEGYMQHMTFSLLERRQIKSNELHYFDSPWLGSIVKVTEFTGKPDHE